MKFLNKQTTSTDRRAFSIQAKPKTLFALGSTQKVGHLRCFSLAFDNSKTQLEKIRQFKLKYANMRTTSINKFFSFYSKPNFGTKTQTKSGTAPLIFVRFRQL